MTDRPGYREHPVQFGPDQGLFGILCLPAAPRPVSPPATILISGGFVHRAGTSRLHVDLARAMASRGFPSLRFDLSGIGDSLPRSQATSVEESAQRDIGDAMAYLRAGHGAERFVLCGYCAGAYDALERAERDADVVGLFLIDLNGSFVNVRHRLVHYTRALRKPGGWRGALRVSGRPVRVLRRVWWRRTPEAGRSSAQVLGVRRRLSRQSLRGSAGRLLQRGVRLSFVFTDGQGANYNHDGQLRATHPGVAASPHCSVTFLRGSEHDLSRASDRGAVVDRFLRWIEELAG